MTFGEPKIIRTQRSCWKNAKRKYPLRISAIDPINLYIYTNQAMSKSVTNLK